MKLECTVNGERRHADGIWAGESLLHVLRERMGLPGSKNACEQGECGSCSILMDGDLVCACLVQAGQAEGRTIVTVEGLSAGSAGDATEGEAQLSDVQQAFLDSGAVQCGFCTPGLVVAVEHLLQHDPDPSDEVLREELAGNLCRCTGYVKVIDAVHMAAARRRGEHVPARTEALRP